MAESYSLLPNIRKVVRSAYHAYGQPVEATTTTATYVNAITTIFRTYLTTRDRDMKLMTQHDIDEYQKEVKSLSIETASRNFIKQLFERMYSEDGLFTKIFNIELVWSPSPESAFQAVKLVNTSMVHPGNIVPLATNLQAVLQTAQLQVTCNVVGWLANEYGVVEVEEDESPSFRKYREYAARLLADHLWPFTDNLFEAEITKSLTKAPAQDSHLKISPVVGGVASSNAYPLVKRAIELLAMFDQAMPKERSVSHLTRPNVCLLRTNNISRRLKTVPWCLRLCGRQSRYFSELKQESSRLKRTLTPISLWSRTYSSLRMSWYHSRLGIYGASPQCSTLARFGTR